jgi:hypothetical protein
VSAGRFEVLDEEFGSRSVRQVFCYERRWGLPSEADRREIVQIMKAQPGDEQGLAAALPSNARAPTPH